MSRQGKGKGKGKGWKNIIASDSYRHELARRGIKTKVTLSKTKRKKLNNKLLKLFSDKSISGYNLVENPRIKKKDTYQVVYGHDVVKKHRDLIVDKLDNMGVDYYVVPREAKFVTDETFIKTKGQIKSDDIISNDNEYQIIVDVNRNELKKLEEYLRTKTVNYDPPVLLIESTLNPTKTSWEQIPLDESYTTPDIRIRDRKKYDRFKKADKIIKKLDKNTDLVILSVRGTKTKNIRKALRDEIQKDVLVQDYKPKKHSLYNFIKEKTK